MRDAFKEALGVDFLNKGGRELLVTAKVEVAEDEVFDLVQPCLRKASESDVEELIREAFKRALREASVSPIGDNGKPRMLKLTAWMAHSGRANDNREGFTDEDLKAAVEEGLFAAPYFGMVDYNHDFNLYGVWYNSKFAFDPEAGANGIIVEGAIFAWRYAELADKMLAMQSRLGHIDVSMACLPRGIEFAEDALGEYTILRRPVFFTTSVLDVDPADPDARAVGSEETGETSEEREVQLLSANLKDKSRSKEPMMEDYMENLETIVEALREVVAEDNQARMEPLVEAARRLPEVTAELETATEALTVAKAEVETLTATVATLTTEKDEVSLAASTAKAELEAQTEELEALRQFKADAEAKEAEDKRAEIRAARLAELSEAARAEFEGLEADVQERLLTRWEDDAEWQVARVALISAKNRYEEASRREGGLAPGTGTEGESRLKTDKFVKKN